MLDHTFIKFQIDEIRQLPPLERITQCTKLLEKIEDKGVRCEESHAAVFNLALKNFLLQTENNFSKGEFIKAKVNLSETLRLNYYKERFPKYLLEKLND